MLKNKKTLLLLLGIITIMTMEMNLHASGKKLKTFPLPAPKKAPDLWNLPMLFKAPAYTAAPYYDAKPELDIKPVFYEGLPYKGKSSKVFAWIGMPKTKDRKVPGIILVHGGGGTAFKYWVRLWIDRGYAVIAMDIAGHIPVHPKGMNKGWARHPNAGPRGWGRFEEANLPVTDQWPYHVVADVILAHSLLRSLPKVDKERIGITGISWGGMFTEIVAGLDHRFKFAAPVYGCGFLGEDSFWQETVFQKIGDKKVNRWLKLWDPSRYLGQAQMPMLFCNGTNDKHFRPDSWRKTCRLPKGTKTLCMRIRMRHDHPPASDPKEIRVFADSIVRNGKALPEIIAQGRNNNKVWATYKSIVPVVKAELNYTKDAGPWRKRKWSKDATEINTVKHRVDAKLPTGVRAYYLNIFDKRGCIVSTEHINL